MKCKGCTAAPSGTIRWVRIPDQIKCFQSSAVEQWSLKPLDTGSNPVESTKVYIMEKKIREKLVRSKLDRDEVSKMTLSLLVNEIDKMKKDKRIETLSDDDVMSLIKKEVKKRNQSIDVFTLGKRFDLAAKEEQELKILEDFLPEPVSYSELLAIATRLKEENPGIHEGRLFGMVNKETGGLVEPGLIKQAMSENK